MYASLYILKQKSIKYLKKKFAVANSSLVDHILTMLHTPVHTRVIDTILCLSSAALSWTYAKLV